MKKQNRLCKKWSITIIYKMTLSIAFALARPAITLGEESTKNKQVAI